MLFYDYNNCEEITIIERIFIVVTKENEASLQIYQRKKEKKNMIPVRPFLPFHRSSMFSNMLLLVLKGAVNTHLSHHRRPKFKCIL